MADFDEESSTFEKPTADQNESNAATKEEQKEQPAPEPSPAEDPEVSEARNAKPETAPPALPADEPQPGAVEKTGSGNQSGSTGSAPLVEANTEQQESTGADDEAQMPGLVSSPKKEDAPTSARGQRPASARGTPQPNPKSEEADEKGPPPAKAWSSPKKEESAGGDSDEELLVSESEKKAVGNEPAGEEADDDKAYLKTQLPIDFLVHEMEQDVRDGYLVRELYIYVPFLILFLFFSLYQLPIEATHWGLQALRDTVDTFEFPVQYAQNETLWLAIQNNERPMIAPDKHFEDIANAGDWGDWLQKTTGQLFHCGDLGKQPRPTTPNELNGMPIPIRGQHYFVGTMRLRTLRVRPDSCAMSADVMVNPGLYPSRYNITDQSCWASHKEKHEETLSPRCNFRNPIFPSQSMYEYKDCSQVPGTLTTTEQGVYHCGGYIVEIPFNASCAQAMEYVDLLTSEACPFVDDIATRFVVMEFFTYLPAHDTFYSVKMINEVTAGGGWIPTSQFRAFILFTSQRTAQAILDFFFLAFVLYYCVSFVMNLKEFYHDERSVLKYFLNFWTLLEAVNVVTYLTVFGLRWTWWSESVSVHKQFPFGNAYPNLEQSLWVYSQMRYALAFNFILTFLKVLKYLKISQKLNVIAVTFDKSQSDVLGLLVIFVLVITGYAVAGTSLFGAQMWWFSSIDRSFSGLMFMIMGEMDYLGMKAVNPILAGLYFWSFLILSFFLLLNFIVAVVSEAFNQAGEQEWSMPLVDAFMLTIDGAVKALRPRAIIREIKLSCRRRSSLWIRSQVLSYVKQNAVFLKLKYPTALEIPVSAQEILKWVPGHLRGDYATFFQEDWESLQVVYKLRAESDQEMSTKQRKEVVVEGTRKAINMKELDNQWKEISERLISLDETGRDLIQKLRIRLGKDTEVKSPPGRPSTRDGNRPGSAPGRRRLARRSQGAAGGGGVSDSMQITDASGTF